MIRDGGRHHWIYRNVGNAQFVLLDGDHVGRRIEDLMLRNALPRLYFLLKDLDEAVVLLARAFRKAGGLVYLAGGDSVLGSIDNVRTLLDGLAPVRNALPFTFSGGVGTTVQEALTALKLAKARGPGQIVRVRRIGGELRAAHWEDPDGWRDERPEPVLRDPAPRGRSASSRSRRRPVPRRARVAGSPGGGRRT